MKLLHPWAFFPSCGYVCVSLSVFFLLFCFRFWGFFSFTVNKKVSRGTSGFSVLSKANQVPREQSCFLCFLCLSADSTLFRALQQKYFRSSEQKLLSLRFSFLLSLLYLTPYTQLLQQRTKGYCAEFFNIELLDPNKEFSSL